MAPALTSSPPSFRPLSSPLRRRAATVLCRASKPGADDDAAKKRTNLFADLGKLADATSLIPALPTPAAGSLFAGGGGGRGRKDSQTVFVAGATGQAGVRVAQTLLRQGFAVRAGVPDLESAQELARLAAAYRLISPAEARRLNAVESDFVDPEAIAKAIGPAAKVVVTVGPGEKGPEAGGVTTDDALRVVQAADLASAAHVVVVYDEGASGGLGGGGSTYNVLDGFTSFFSNLFARVQTLTLSQFLAKVVETDVSYTLVKASLTDDYSPESSYPLVLSKEGASRSPSTTSSTDTGKVSKSQIAALVADIFSNVAVAESKVVEVSTNSSAVSKPIAEAFVAIPEDSRRKEYQEAAAKAQAEEEALASQRASEAEAAASDLEAKGKESPSEEAAASPVNGAQASLENLLSRAKGVSKDFSWEKFSTQLAEATTPRTSTEKGPKAQIATVRGQAKAKKLAPQRAVVKPAAQKVKPQLKQPDTKPEVRPVFGGLFKQETVYVDDD